MVGSRLCHDLVSPLGAIGNGLELLDLTYDSSPELQLMHFAVRSAQGRLRLFRLAYGVALPGQTARGSELSMALRALEASGRINVQVTVPEDSLMQRKAAKRLSLAVLCAETALAWGGDIVVSAEQVIARGKRLNIDTPLWDALSGTPLRPDTATVHFALLARTGPVDVQYDDTELIVRL